MNSVVVLAPHPQFADEVRAVAEPLGFRVVHRLTVEEAEPLLVHRIASVCLLDLEFSGIQAVWMVERILRRCPTCVILAFSAVRESDWEEELYLAGVRQVLGKPLRPKLLAQVLNELKTTSSRPESRPLSASGSLPAPVAPSEDNRVENHSLKVLRRFSEILNHSLDAAALVRESLNLLREVLGVNRSAVFLRELKRLSDEECADAEVGSMRAICTIGIRSTLTQEVGLSTEVGIGARLLETGRILRREETGAGDPVALREFEMMGADVALPILARGEMIGVALFDRRVTGSALSHTELECVFHLLEQVGQAIGNIERHEHLVGTTQLLGDVLRELDSACVVVGSDLAVLHANKAARRVIAGAARRSGTVSFGDLPEELGAKVYQVIQTGAALPPFRYQAQNASGSVYSVSVVPVRGAGQAAGPGGHSALMVMEDRTQTEQLQRLEIEAANLRLVSNMADRLAAEIGNAIVPLSVHHQLFDQRFKEAEFRKSLRTALGDSVKRVDRLVNQMRFIYGNSNKDAQIIAVGDLLDEADKEARSYFPAKSARLDCEPGVRGTTVSGTRGALKHTFSEIILNGYQANAADARVQVRLATVGQNGGGKEVGIEFEDAGEGFSAEAARQASDPFYTQRTVGVGLGLSAVRKIVEDHGGRLEIVPRQSEGHGVVRIFLPAAASQE
jgi:nitrogen-specific signal transduction histidine kinase/DNA-binding NarL/FixJ family response regulator